jgi:hypothetical protein
MLPAPKTGGLYKTHGPYALRFCSGLSVPCTSGGRGRVSFLMESPPNFGVPRPPQWSRVRIRGKP